MIPWVREVSGLITGVAPDASSVFSPLVSRERIFGRAFSTSERLLTNKQTLHIMSGGTSNAVGENYMDGDLFDYDADIPDIDTTIRQPTPEKDGKKDNLGLDEEVKIKKKRVNVKLDEARYGGE